MANYYGYYGVAGSQLGNTSTPAGGTVPASTETLVVQTPVPDNREGPQGGVLINAFVLVGSIAATALGTWLCRQSVTGTSAITGNAIGTIVGTMPAGTLNIYNLQFVDNTGTFPLPAYQLTLNTSSGTCTVLQARLTAAALGE